jgi:hypothetical protein
MHFPTYTRHRPPSAVGKQVFSLGSPFSKRSSAIGVTCILVATINLSVRAGSLNWTLPPFETQTLSDGSTPIPEGTVFHLGVFAGSFVPDAGNENDWLTNWRAADFEFYDSVFSAISGSYHVEANSAPFTEGKQMYVWAIHQKANGGSEQWLGTAANWLVPSGDPSELPVNIDIDDATTILRGSANSTAGTIRMDTVAQSGGIPLIYGSAWLDHYFTAMELADPNIGEWQADPDADGLDNALEFAMGANPLDPQSAGLLEILRVSNSFRLSFPGWVSAAVNVRMAESSTLQEPWLPLVNHPVYLPGEFRWELTAPNSNPRNFFRAAITIPPMP